ncbi:MAG: hypothetical protein V1779_10520 [bacterium]
MRKNIKIFISCKRRANLALLIFIFIINTQLLISQGGSNYSIFGLGDIEISPGAAYEGLAGTSIAFPTEHSINSLNPAVWSKLSKTRLLTGYKFNQHFIQDEKDNVLLQNNGKISTLSSVFVIDTGMGLAVSFGINPYSNVNYLIEVPLEVNFEGLEVTGTSLYQGIGGISTGYIGASVEIIDELSVGISGFATFGVIKSSITTAFNDDNFFVVENKTENKFNGYGFRFGLLYEPLRNFYVGLFTEQHANLEFDQEQIYNSSFNTDTTYTNSNAVSSPNAYGAGASYLLGKFRIGADLKLYQLDGINYNPGPDTKYKNMLVYSLGVSRLGNPSSGANFADKITYNFGIGLKQLYYQVKDNQINDIYASFGMNIPVVGTSIIDATITFGNRGMSSSGLVNEYYGRLSIDISIGETWFKPLRSEF